MKISVERGNDFSSIHAYFTRSIYSLILPPSPCFTDWDHSEFGKHVATLKTSYPHMESDWNDGQSAWEPWVDDFANAAVVYILRSPRNAIVNYYSMKQELALAQNWDSAHSRVSATYTYQARIAGWLKWRDDDQPDLYPLENRDRALIEIEEWGKNIEFW